MNRRANTTLVCLVAMGMGCASAPPTPSAAAPPPGPQIVVKAARFVRPQMESLRFQCGRAHDGIELHFTLVDSRGRDVERRELRVGQIFGGKGLPAGKVVHHRISREKEERLKVVGGARPTIALRSHRIDAAEVASVRLDSAASCHLDSAGETVCEELKDAQVGRTLRLQRVTDPSRGALELTVSFEHDFEQGVIFEVALVDADGEEHPRCRLEVRQPPVFETQSRRYRLVTNDPKIVAVLAPMRGFRVIDQRPAPPVKDGQVDDTSEVSLLCADRQRVRRRATIH